MKNADKPIYPLQHEGYASHPSALEANNDPLMGLTKREYFAAIAMQGYLSSYAGTTADPNPENVAKKSIEYADEILKQLSI